MKKKRQLKPEKEQLDFFQDQQQIKGKDMSLSFSLPDLPTLFRYDDDFALEHRTIRCSDAVWELRVDGKTRKLPWKAIENQQVQLMKHFFVWAAAQYDATTFYRLVSTFATNPIGIADGADHLAKRSPIEARPLWENQLRAQYLQGEQWLLRSFSNFLCENCLGAWISAELEYLKTWDWYGADRGKYRKVLSGEHFLPKDAERKLIVTFDHASKNPQSLQWRYLRDLCVLYWCYQHGFRPIQIASIDLQDVVIRQEDEGTKYSVHATFYRAKQRSASAKEPMPRRMKREWTPLMFEWVEYRKSNANAIENAAERSPSLFGMTPTDVSIAIKELSSQIIDVPISPTLFRHQAAQRMADAGASHLELAEFMGHADIDTGLVYYEASPTQASKVNAALGLSPTYQKIREFSEGRFISAEELDSLPEDQQIGGANHGIFLAGIGGCEVGQSLCQLNPAINCYTCPKFMPLSNKELHRSIAGELQSVVGQFVKAGRSDDSNPAFMQLRHTLESINGILENLDQTIHE